MTRFLSGIPVIDPAMLVGLKFEVFAEDECHLPAISCNIA
jgi:hypothetical protein